MPELPEVEVICQGLRPHLLGRTILEVQCSGKRLRAPIPCTAMKDELCTTIITEVRRRAKYLILTMDGGASLTIHLGMTGNMGIFAAGSRTKKHDHVCWLLDNDTELRFNDTRRFGAIHLFVAENAPQAQRSFFAKMGPEPFSSTCSAPSLHEQASRHRIAIKKFIMDGRLIAGIGNIYANETLFASLLHPERPASSLSLKEWQILLGSIRKILRQAIACGGSTISDFINASGKQGYFQTHFAIYGKAGQPCPRCGTAITKKSIGGRASFICQKCQPAPLPAPRDGQ